MEPAVLIVDDDEGIRSSLRWALEDEGFVVREAGDGITAIEEVRREPPDVVVLDLMLPGMDGFECCRRLRTYSDVPVVVISARGRTDDVVAGLEAGADDYIRKPFDVPELTARLRALRRRVRDSMPAQSETVQAETVQAGDITIEPNNGRVVVAGNDVHVTKTEFRLLFELVTHAGEVFSRETLLERVWDYGYFGDVRIVDVHVARLRAKIEDDSANPRRLLTVRGFGYKIEP